MQLDTTNKWLIVLILKKDYSANDIFPFLFFVFNKNLILTNFLYREPLEDRDYTWINNKLNYCSNASNHILED